MKHFALIKFVNLLAAVVFLIMGFLLIMAFTLNLSVVDELQQAANFDVWKVFILLAGIVSLLTSLVFALGSWKEFQMCSGSQNSVIAEVIYILGLGMELDLELERPLCIDGADAPTKVGVSRSSIFGFGYDDSFKWTFAGRKPLPREDPVRVDVEENIVETNDDKITIGLWEVY